MVDPIGLPGAGNVAPLGPGPAPAGRADASSGKSFKDLLSDSIAEVNQLQKDGEVAQAALASGQTDDIEGVMTAVRKAELAFKTLMQIRNKLVDAYDEIQRMRV